MANNTFINYISSALCREQTRPATADKPESKFISVSVPVTTDISADGFISMAVNPGQVFVSTKKDGTQVQAYRNILVGKPDAMKKVSVCVDATAKTYEKREMSSADIAAAYAASRQAYRAAQTAVAVEEEVEL